MKTISISEENRSSFALLRVHKGLLRTHLGIFGDIWEESFEYYLDVCGSISTIP